MLKNYWISFCLITSLFFCFNPTGWCAEEPTHQEKITQIKLVPEAIQQNGIQTDIVTPKNIGVQIDVVGKITPNRDTMAFIYPRYAGMIKTLTKSLGEKVQADEILATIESNESLQTYELRSPIAGTIIQKHAAQGEQIKENQPIYEIANLDNVWVDLSIYRKDAPFVKVGQPVTINAKESQLQSVGVINYVAPVGIEDSQTLLARVVLPNTTQCWVCGMYVDATITIQQKQASLAVKIAAIQKIKNNSVIFIQNKDSFIPVPVKLGMNDGDYVEVLEGLQAGQRYVSKNSFVLKAELGKSEIEDED